MSVFEKLRAAADRVRNAREGVFNTTHEEIESIVCPRMFSTDDCVEIMCRRSNAKQH